MKKAFSIIELVFVIVILGILSAVALPKFASTVENAHISKGRADVASIRASILTERQSQLIKGINTYIPKLSSDSTSLFTGDGTRTLLTYGIVSGTTDGKWSASGTGYKLYNFKVNNTDILFTYDSDAGTFTCDRTSSTCKKIVD